MSTLLTTDGSDPLDTLAEKEHLSSNPDPEAPRCAPGGSLILTGTQLNEIVRYVIDQAREMEKMHTPWAERRNEWLDEFQNDFSHRNVPNEIFERSNMSFNQSRRNTMPFVARLTRDYFGTEPYFSTTPRGIKTKNKSVLAEKIDRYIQFKEKPAKLKSTLIEGILLASVVGQRVVKITHARDVTFYKRDAVVMLGPDGKEFRTPKGDVIFQDDLWVDTSYFDQISETQNPDPEPPQPPQAPAQKPGWWQFWKSATPQAPITPQATGVIVLKKDPRVVLDEDNNVGPLPIGKYKRMKVDLIYEGEKGADVKGVHHRDFLCPLEAADIQTTPIIMHRFSMTQPEAVQRYVAAVNPDLLDDEEKTFFAELTENMHRLQGDTASPKTAAEHPVYARGEITERFDDFNGKSEFLEAYLSTDVDGDGRLEEMTITVARQHEFALTFDYTPNVVAPGVKRPFRVERIFPVPDRWYGYGMYEWNSSDQRVIDWFLNRIVYGDAITGMLHYYDPEAFDGADTEAPVTGEKLYRLKNPATFSPEKAFGSISLPPISDSSLELMKLTMQSSQASQGNLSPGGDTVTDMPSSKLKYGVQAIQQAGQENYALYAIMASESVEAIIQAFVLTELANMDAVEEFEYESGDQTLTETMVRSEVENLRFDVALELTLSRGDQISDQNAQATELVQQYFAFPAFQRIVVRPFFIKRLQAIDIPDAEQAVPAPSQDEVNASYQAYMASMQPPPPAPPPQGTPSGGPPPATAGMPGPQPAGKGAGQPGPVTPPKVI